MASRGREGKLASECAAGRLWHCRIGVFTDCVKPDCEAAAGRKMHRTERLVRRKGRPSREGWRAVLPTLPWKGRVRGEALALFLAPMCQGGTSFHVNLVRCFSNPNSIDMGMCPMCMLARRAWRSESRPFLRFRNYKWFV